MALVVKDRVKDTTTTTGTGTITLANSPPNGYQAFSSLGDGSTTYYAIEDADKTDWEVGLGTYTLSGHTLARTTVLASTNSNNAISLSSGEHTVFCDYPSGKAFLSDEGIDKTFTADGSITAGKPCILKSDGDASQIALIGNSVTEAIGSVQYFDSGTESYYNFRIDSTQLAGDKFINIYNEGTNQYPCARIGQVGTDKTITWGTEVVLSSSAQRMQYKAVVHDPDNDRIGIFVEDYTSGTDPYKLFGATATYSGTTLTVGTMTDFASIDEGGPVRVWGEYDPDNEKPVVVVGNAAGSALIAIQVDISGSTPSVDHQTTLTDAFGRFDAFSHEQLAYDTSADRFVFIYRDTGDSDTLKASVITNSGSAFTWGTSGTIEASTEDAYCIAFDSSNNKMLTVYDSGEGIKYSVGTVTGGSTNTASWTTGVSLGTFGSVYAAFSILYNSIASKFLLALPELGTTDQEFRLYTATLSDDTLTLGSTSYQLNSFASAHVVESSAFAGVFDSVTNDPIVISLAGQTHANPYNRLMAYVFETGQTPVANLDNNYLGVASTTATDGNEVQVNMPDKSINVDQTGLTIGEEYFCDTAGNIEKFMTSSTSTDTTTSNSAFVEDSTTYANVITSISYCSTSGYYIKTFNSGSTGYPTYKTGTYNSSTNNIDWGAATTIQSYNLRGNYVICHANASGAIGLLYTIRDGSTDTLKCSTTTLSSGVLQGLATAVSVVSDTTEEFYPLGIVYDAGQSRFVATWATITGGTYPIYANAFQPDADNAPTWSSSNQITALAGGSSDNLTSGNFHSLIYDPDTQRVVQFYFYMDSGTRKVGGKVLSLSGSTITAGANALGATAINTSSSNTWSTCYDTQNDKILLAYRATDGKISIYFITVTGGGTNTLSFSTSANITTEQAQTQNITFDETNNKMIMFWSSDTSSRLGYISQFTSDGSALTEVGTRSQLSGTNTFDCSLTWSGVWVSGKGTAYSSRTDSATKSLDFTTYFGTTTTYTQTDAQYIGKAVSATDLQLKETPTELIGNSAASITKGKPVVVDADGDFAEIVSSEAYSAKQIISSGSASKTVMASDGNGTILLGYVQGATENLRAGTISGTTITWGTVTVISSTDGNGRILYWDSDKDCFVSVCRDTSANYVIKGSSITVSGTAITVVDDATTNVWGGSGYQNEMVGNFDSTVNKGLILNTKGNSPTATSAIVLSLDGSKNVSFGTEVINNDRYYYLTKFSHNSDQGINVGVVGNIYNSGTSVEKSGISAVGVTISGTVPTFVTTVVLDATTTYKSGYTLYDSSNSKTVAIYQQSTNMYSNVLSISGSTITGGGSVLIESSRVDTADSNVGNRQGNFNINSGKMVISYKNNTGTNIWYVRSGLLSGSTITWDDEQAINSSDETKYVSLTNVSSSSSNVIVNYTNNTASPSELSDNFWTIPSSNLTSENYIGIAKSSASGANKTAIITKEGGVDSNQSSLTPGQLYYVQTDGTISTTAGSPSVVAGIGLSATKLLVTKS